MIKLKQLLKEDIGGEELVHSGIKKVFANAHDTGQKTIPYDRIEAVGLGYIKDVSTAQKAAYQAAVQIADKYGYWDDNEHEQFAMNDGTVTEHDETDMTNPEEKREVQIAKEILASLDEPMAWGTSVDKMKEKIKGLANELIQMHGAK